VADVSFRVDSGETLAIVGESGSGKSVTALSVVGLIRPPGRIAGGRVVFQGRNLRDLDERDLQTIRGAAIGFVFQEPMAALNPVMTIAAHLRETQSVHGLGGPAADRRALDLLDMVRIPDPRRVAASYPHQLSGGTRQRALIAMALACRPALVIADEPTTALDVTIQAEILDLLSDMKRDLGVALLLITHDLAVVAETADRVAVMYAGRIVEEGPAAAVIRAPRHPYTQGLIASLPRRGAGGPLHVMDGAVPAIGEQPSGCAFHPRCPQRFAPCAAETPALLPIDGVDVPHAARCYLHDPAWRSEAREMASRAAR
jgi:oligopeptide/dipeptide ABC transporter ATP-binding protein